LNAGSKGSGCQRDKNPKGFSGAVYSDRLPFDPSIESVGQMLTHRFLRGIAVACAHGRNNAAVLIKGLPRAPPM